MQRFAISPERGGIITSLKLHDVEVLYFDQETFADTSRSVRGGIPILFPNAGAFNDPAFPLLKQHGFARERNDWKSEKDETSFTETLIADDETRAAYPYNFKLSLSGAFQKDGSFTLEQKVENLEDEKTMPVSMGLHPYFKVKDANKGHIKFNFEGGAYIQDSITLWGNGTFVSIDNPKIKDPTAVMEIIMPELGTLILDVSAGYEKIWVWSEAGKDFICIEPVMRDPGGLVTDPYQVAPKDSIALTVNFNLKK
jgi:galactose mutarotase-like enzyme